MNRQQRRAAAKGGAGGPETDVEDLRAQAWTSFGQGRLQDAALTFRRLAKLMPGLGEAHLGLGRSLLSLGRPDDAIRAFKQAVSLDAEDVHALTLLGCTLQEQAHVDEAIEAFRRVAAIAPDHPQAYANLAGALKERGQVGEAIDVCRSAIARRPGEAESHFNLSLLLLTAGQWEEGWQEYEWRLKVPGVDVHRGFAQPQWDGTDAPGKILLVHAEQGLGDVIQFARYLPLLAGRVKSVVFAVPPSLAALFRDLPGVDRLVTGSEPEPPAFDLQCPLLSLPAVLNTRVDSVPGDCPYLTPDPARVRAMAERFPALAGGSVRVGLVWSGEPRLHAARANAMDRRRSLPLARFASLASVPGVTLFSLQKGAAAQQMKSSPLRLIDPMGAVADFADTAAVIAHLDLVISVDTAVAHLAGALGKPVWILSRFDGCWRWLSERDDTPWYPTARLFRQTAPGDWSSVAKRVRESLAREAAR